MSEQIRHHEGATDLVRDIAAALMTPAGGPRCHRIALMEKTADGEKNHGGLCVAAVERVIETKLLEYFAPVLGGVSDE